MAEPTDRSTVSHLFTSSQPTVSCVASVGCSQSSAQIPPGRLMTTSPAMFAQVDVLVTIHIDHRRYFTQRFSPTGFFQNAPNSHCNYRNSHSRIQDKTCTFSSITGLTPKLERLVGRLPRSHAGASVEPSTWESPGLCHPSSTPLTAPCVEIRRHAPIVSRTKGAVCQRDLSYLLSAE